jgi:hypothetical protein
MDYCILISIYGEPPLLLLAPFGLLPTAGVNISVNVYVVTLCGAKKKT